MATMLQQVDLSNIERIVPFPFPVKSIGSTTGGSEEKERNYYFNDQVEICLRLLEGQDAALDRIDGKTYRTGFPHVFVKMPFIPFSYTFYNRTSLFFSYSLETLELLKKQGIEFPSPLWEIELTDEITLLVHKLMELLNHSMARGVCDRIDLCCFQLLQEILIQHDGQKKIHDPLQDRILAVASYLKIHFTREIDIDELISKHGMSRRTFFRHWKKHFSVSPAEYKMNLKLEDAARRLRESNLNIQDITEKLNFRDSAYLAKLFRRCYGKTPLQYRKESQNSFKRTT